MDKYVIKLNGKGFIEDKNGPIPAELFDDEPSDGKVVRLTPEEIDAEWERVTKGRDN